ncbi:MAG: carboxypeptidase-like regulatory domain-containing protein [Acidobacteriaceae bacterium]
MSRREQQSVQKVAAPVRKIRFQRTLLGGVLALCLSLSVAFAQSVTGSITGEVTDPSGAVVPGAKVVAQNLDTGVESPTTTNTNGFYRIQFLPIGRYQVTVQAPGFNTETVPPFNLEVLQTPTFNVKLQVGSAATTLQVSAAAPILNTNDATVGPPLRPTPSRIFL